MSRDPTKQGGSPPRIYCLPAVRAPVVAVFRRGPSDWWHVGRWDLRAPTYEPGAWFRGQLYPRRSDLSPDGRWLCYVALKSSTWDVGDTYVAISRLPWITALAAWRTCGTWTRGFRFVDRRSGFWSIGTPAHGDVSPCQARYGMQAYEPVQFAAERHRGWQESPDSPPRVRGDLFDQRRNARLFRARPGGELRLVVESVGRAGGEWQAGAVEGLRTCYWLESADDLRPLDELQWADWDRDGRLLAATRTGKLQIRRVRGLSTEVGFEADLSGLEPAPSPAPDWAARW